MAPVTDKSTLEVAPKRTLQDISNDDESDEGFVSPSVQRIGLKSRRESLTRQPDSESSSNGSASDNDSQGDSSSATSSPPSSQALREISDEEMVVEQSNPTEANSVKNNINNSEGASNNNVNKIEGASNKDTSAGVRNRDTSSKTNSTGNSSSNNPDVRKELVESKAESLAKFVVYTLLGKVNGESTDNVERTLLKCVQKMSSKHEILFKGMMKRVKVTRETGYVSFVTVANTLFEDERMVITWSRIVALYAFGGQLALHCKESNMEDFACTISEYLGKYARDILTPFVMSIGGWNKICEEFPEEPDMEKKFKKMLSLTAVGLLGIAAMSYVTSR